MKWRFFTWTFIVRMDGFSHEGSVGKIVFMNAQSSSFLQLLEGLKSGQTFFLPEACSWVRMENDRILLSSSQFTARMNLEDFEQLYGHHKAIVQKEQGFINEHKDEEYYRWRQ